MRPLSAVLALACASVVASGARADNYPVLNGYGQVVTMCAKSQGSVLAQCSAQTGVNWAASGLAPVTGSLSATGTSTTFIPLAGRPFSVALSVTGAATVQLEREAPGDTTWYPLVAPSGQQIYALQTSGTQAVSETMFANEPETGAIYRLHVTACSGCTVGYRLEH